MITLYHRPKTRSSRFLFLLEELGVPYRIQLVTTRNRDGTGAPDPSNPHPHGKVPAISGSVFEPAIMSKAMKVEVPRGTAGWVAVEEMMPAVLARLGRAPYMLGEQFSAVDVLYGSTFALFAQSSLIPQSPLLEPYVQSILKRPAFARALARDAG